MGADVDQSTDDKGGDSAGATSQIGVQAAINGSLADLVKYHQAEINKRVEPLLPMVLFRVGPKISPPNTWYFALLNKEQLSKSEEVINAYTRGDPIDIVSGGIMNMTLEQLLARYIFSPDNVPADYQMAYNETREVVYGMNPETPSIKRSYEGGKRILYNLNQNPDKLNEIDLGKKAGECLTYVEILHDNGKRYGAITIDLSYALTGKGGTTDSLIL